MGKYRLSDIVSVDRLKLVLDSLSKATGLNLCVLDDMGGVVIYPCNDIIFCKAVRENEGLKQRCLRLAAHSCFEAGRAHKCIYYRCRFGLTDFAVPIFYRGEYVGAFCGGGAKTDIGEDRLDSVEPRASLEEYPALAEIFSRLPYMEAGAFYETASLVNQLASFVGNFKVAANMVPGGEKKASGLNKLQPALKYIAAHYGEKISISELAALCFITPEYFSRLFAGAVGSTVSAYILSLRIKKAKELLANREMKISAVAHAVGYDDPSYFVRKFKQATGVTPTQYQISAESGKGERAESEETYCQNKKSGV